MDEATREEFILAIQKAVLVAGAKDYEEGIRTAKKLIDFAYNGVRSIETIEGLRTALDAGPSFSGREEKILLVGMQLMPQLLRIGLTKAAEKAKATLPLPPAGRPPAFTASEAQAVLKYIVELHRKGSPMNAAKLRAGQKFGRSKRTIDRLWSKRSSIPVDESAENEPNLEDVLSFFTKDERARG